jgi:hypothetical protein
MKQIFSFISGPIGIIALILGLQLGFSPLAFSQCKSVIKIDGKRSVVDQSLSTAIMLPYWLTSGQTLALGYGVQSVSIIEFTVNGTALEFSAVLNFTSETPVSVPTGKVWKMESVSMINNINNYNSIKYSLAGTYTFTVPSCAEEICIEVWGGGGAGGGSGTVSYNGGSGGGGGGYGAECFAVTPGDNYTVTVGAGGVGSASSVGGTGQTTSVGSLISATGGTGGGIGSGSAGGTGGTSTAASYATGGTGYSGSSAISGRGGAAANGGLGALGNTLNSGGTAATNFASGGSGAYTQSTSPKAGGAGGDGQVIITW